MKRGPSLLAMTLLVVGAQLPGRASAAQPSDVRPLLTTDADKLSPTK